MGDILAFLVVVLIVAVVASLSIISVLIIAVFVAAAYLVLLPADYVSAMISQILGDIVTPEESSVTFLARLFRTSDAADREMAIPNYFFGPVEIDAGVIFRGAVERSSDRWRWGVSTAGSLTDNEGLVDIVLFFGLWLGLIVGTALGTVFAAGVAVVHMGLLAVSLLLVFVASGTLRYTDSAMRFVRGVVMRCPNPRCSKKVRPYPGYRCPRCGGLHRQIRPGPFGVVKRVCKCGETLPTLLLIGAGKLDAVCLQCGYELPRGIGTAAEIVIPVFGSVNAGKTRLIYMLAMAFRQLAADAHASLEMDEETGQRISMIGEALAASGHTVPTPARTPEPYILRLRLGLDRRMIYLFDAAGEMHHRLATLDDLGYLDKGRTLLFVADPLSWDTFWNEIPGDTQAELAGARSNAEDIEIAYEQTREHMRRMGRPEKEISFAFVVSKADILCKGTNRPMPTGHELRAIFDDPDRVDEGNMIRDASRSFRSVEFFPTAAVRDEDGIVDGSVVRLARWILRSEGVFIDRP
jgi:hypothetical protein